MYIAEQLASQRLPDHKIPGLSPAWKLANQNHPVGAIG